ncbi:MAG TPA: hypothetical protein DCY20_01870, partial [Firmicutes bacterium]|nr:hypothetical protein [Bacillota bacterium]
TRNVTIDSPVEPTNAAMIADFMETAIATDIFYVDSADELVKLESIVAAQLCKTDVETINF